MNSYPSELILQHAPLMFVAGLEAFAPPAASPPLVNGDTKSHTPDVDAEFSVLAHRLRKTLGVHRKPQVWDPERAKEFDVILVDKNVRFPPRKILPPSSAPQPADSVPHSPLSPLTPTSPLYPDGLIAPIWVRKHTALVPSIFVLFLRLYEAKKEGDVYTEDEKDREKEKDMELAKEIAERKRGTAERGIKLTVVLLASRSTLDDPGLDVRLSTLRRAASLDSRAALFVLSPVSPSELSEFVTSLGTALHPVALAYYANHSKSSRRKRSRPHNAHLNGPNAGAPPRPLRPEGWAVRYEYKMGIFAEFRGEIEVARKHMEDCWAALLDMFGSTAILPPRTKRWAEAKVLSDTLSFKIVKFYLYQSLPSDAIRQFRLHISRFTEFSRGWGMGEETVEFWGWAARQYRLLSELLELALVHPHPLILPSLLPSPVGTNSQYPQLLQPGQPIPVAGLSPADALMGPAYWYLCAAECTRERRKRWMALLEHTPEEGRSQGNFQTEKKVDHQAVIRELYTKAYELFKKYTQGDAEQSRLPFYVAFRVAEAYFETGEWEMAVRFFERTAKLYRREEWDELLLPMLRMWHECAKNLSDIQAVVRLTLELMGLGEQHLEDELLAVLETTSPATSDIMVLELPPHETFLRCRVVFWQIQAFCGEGVAFQLHINAPMTVDMSRFPISSVRFYFSDDREAVTIEHRSRDSSDTAVVECVDLGNLTGDEPVYANLRWLPGEVKAFSGLWQSHIPVELKILSVVFCLNQGAWTIELPQDPNLPSSERAPTQWFHRSESGSQFLDLYAEDNTSCFVIPKPHDFHVHISHNEPAYLGERYPIVVQITNAENRDLEAVLDILLQPSEDDDVNKIAVDDHESSGFLKGIPFGIVRGGEIASKVLWLTSTGSALDRTLDLSVQTRTVDPNDSSTISSTNSTETLRTVTIPILQPIACSLDTTYNRQLPAVQPLSDSDGSGSRESPMSMEATMAAIFSCVGPWPLTVQSVNLVRNEGLSTQAAIISTSLQDEEQWPLVWEGNDVFQATCHFAIKSRSESEPGDIGQPSVYTPSLGDIVVSWYRKHPDHPQETILCTTKIPLPAVLAPLHGVVGVLMPPSTAYMHSPFALRLTIHNYHKSRAASISVQADSSESFALPGPRRTRVTSLVPGASVEVVFRLYPVALGLQPLPPISILERSVQSSPTNSKPDQPTSPVEYRRSSYEEEEEEFTDGTEAPILVADLADPDRAAVEAPSTGVAVFVIPHTAS